MHVHVCIICFLYIDRDGCSVFATLICTRSIKYLLVFYLVLICPSGNDDQLILTAPTAYILMILLYL